MPELLHRLTTINEKLEVYEDRIVITKLEKMHVLTKDEVNQKVTHIKDITSVQFKEAAFLRLGYLQFSMPGSLRETNENTISFPEHKNQIAKKIKNTAERLIAESSKGTTVVNKLSEADELKKFKQLMDEGIISQEEYEIKKKQIIGIDK